LKTISGNIIQFQSQEENDNSGVVEGSRQASKDHSSSVAVPQRQLTFKQKIQHIPPILHLMIPLALVYVAQYMINQGLAQLIIFKCSEGFHLDYNAQYRWYQARFLSVLERVWAWVRYGTFESD
ncbi:hypothetical protein COOONC_23881, partial [Cooperia oncophora]